MPRKQCRSNKTFILKFTRTDVTCKRTCTCMFLSSNHAYRVCRTYRKFLSPPPCYKSSLPENSPNFEWDIYFRTSHPEIWVTGQNGIGQNGTDKKVRTKWHRQN